VPSIWDWEVYRDGKPLPARLQGSGLRSEVAAKGAGNAALRAMPWRKRAKPPGRLANTGGTARAINKFKVGQLVHCTFDRWSPCSKGALDGTMDRPRSAPMDLSPPATRPVPPNRR
jgi:hypothetical protein